MTSHELSTEDVGLTSSYSTVLCDCRWHSVRFCHAGFYHHVLPAFANYPPFPWRAPWREALLSAKLLSCLDVSFLYTALENITHRLEIRKARRWERLGMRSRVTDQLMKLRSNHICLHPKTARLCFCPLIYPPGLHLWALVAHCLYSNRPAHDGLTGDRAEHVPAIRSQASPALQQRDIAFFLPRLRTFHLLAYLFTCFYYDSLIGHLLISSAVTYTVLGTQTKHSDFGA